MSEEKSVPKSDVTTDAEALAIMQCCRKPCSVTVEKGQPSLTIRVGKPADKFFRVNPDPNFTVEICLLETTERLKKVQYAVASHLYDRRLGMKMSPLRLCLEYEGGLFFWPLGSLDHAEWNTWIVSAIECATEAEEKWVSMSSNLDDQKREWIVAKADFGEPSWPKMSLQELLVVAFKDKMIMDKDHTVLRKKRGEI